MKKNVRTLLIAVIAVVVLAGAAGLLLLIGPQDNADPESGSSSEDAAKVTILETDPESITRIAVENKKGSYVFLPDEKAQSGFTIQGMEKQDIRDGYVQYSTQNGYKLSAIRDFGERENLAEYGLEAPEATYTMTYQDGAKKTVRVGLAVPGDAGRYYVALEGETRVYSAEIYGLMLDSALGYINTTLAISSSPTTVEDTEALAPTNLDRVVVEGKAWENPLWIEKNKNFTKAGTPFFFSEMLMVKPIYASCAGEGWAALRQQLSSVIADRTVSVDVSQKGLKEYGMDTPTVEVDYVMDGKTVSLLVGKKSGNGYYIMKKGGRAIFEIGEDAISSWTDGDFYVKTANYVRQYNVTDIQEIEIQTWEETMDFFIEQIEGAPDESGNNTTMYMIRSNENELNFSTFEDFFARISKMQSEGMPEGPLEGDPILTITLMYREDLEMGGSQIRFYYAGDRRYHVVYNEEGCYVTVKESYVEELVEAAKRSLGDIVSQEYPE